LHSATVVGNDRVLFVGGLDTYGNRNSQQTALSSVTLWRPKTGSWETSPGLLGPRFAHEAIALPDGDVLVIGGTATADRDEPFGPFLATVELLGEKTTTARASMRLARVGHTATLLSDGRVMVVGGIGDDRAALVSVEIYDLKANSWTPGPSLATGRANHTATLLSDGRVLVTGGTDSDGNAVPHAEIWSRDSAAWSDAGELLAPRSKHVATLLKNGSVLLSGGYAHAERAARTLELWHPDSNAWTVASEVPTDLRDHHAALMRDGSVLLFGSDLYQRNAVVLVWLPDEPEQQHLDVAVGASVTELEDGRVLLAGGSRRQSSSASASLYDIKTDRWTATAPMHFARSGHRTVRLADGGVLVAGGIVTDNVRRDGDPATPLGEIWNPQTNRWTLTDDVSAVSNTDSNLPTRDSSASMETFSLPDGSTLGWNGNGTSLRKAGEQTWIPVAQDTRWSGLVGIVNAANDKTYAFRNADVPGHTFPRLEAVWLNMQARRWQPNAAGYVERESPAMLALSDTEIMVAGGASAVVQIWNSKTNEWRNTGWLPAPLRSPSILSLRDGGVMLAGRVMDNEATVVCALWNPDTSTWTECGRFDSDSIGERRAPVLRDLGANQTLLVYGNERALVRGADGSWVATKLDFPKNDSMPSPKDEVTAYTTDIGAVWNPLEKRWSDATDVLFAHRYGMQATRTPDRRWIFASRGNVLQWQPRERLFSRLPFNQAPESYLDSVVPINNAGCAVVWNNTRELSFAFGRGAYSPIIYARNFTAKSWSTDLGAPAAPLSATALLTKNNTLLLAGVSRDDIGGGAAWQSYRVTCDKVAALTPVRSLYLPTRTPSATKPEPVSTAARPQSRANATYLETWQETAMSLADSTRKNPQGTFIFGGIVLLLLIRLSNRWSVYVEDDDGHAPARTIDLAMLAISACALLLTLGAPWPVPRTLVLVLAAALIVFSAKRLWANIETPRNKVLFGVPLGACLVMCSLTIGSIITSRVYAIVDSLRDY
jgi:hypothetical protein